MTKHRTPRTQTSTYQTFVYSNDTATYIAKAASYITTNSAAWQIKQVDDSTTNQTEIKWASGNQNFDKILDNYLTLTYE